jgi:hypothetical protein
MKHGKNGRVVAQIIWLPFNKFSASADPDGGDKAEQHLLKPSIS